MTEITMNNIKEFWNTLAARDSGMMVQPVAEDIADFWTELLSNGREFMGADGYTYFLTDSVRADRKVTALLRGFQSNTGYYAEDGLNLTVSLDLHNLIIRSDVAQEFQDWLAYNGAYSGDPYNWIWRYQQALIEGGNQNKPRKARRTRKSA